MEWIVKQSIFSSVTLQQRPEVGTLQSLSTRVEKRIERDPQDACNTTQDQQDWPKRKRSTLGWPEKIKVSKFIF